MFITNYKTAVFVIFGGEGGIRTPEALIRTCTLSRGVHSTSLPLLRSVPSISSAVDASGSVLTAVGLILRQL